MYTFNRTKEEFSHVADPSESVSASSQQAYSLIQSGDLSREDFEQWIGFISNESFDSGYSAALRDEYYG